MRRLVSEPAGTQAIAATEDELRRDLGGVPERKRSPKPTHHMRHGVKENAGIGNFARWQQAAYLCAA